MTDHTDGCRIAANHICAVASGEKLTLTGGAGEVYFETDQAITDTPTLSIVITDNMGNRPRAMLLEEVTFYMNPTNAETYQLYLMQGATAGDLETFTDIVFWSPAAQADSVFYSYHASGYQATVSTDEVASYKLPRVVEFASPGILYYMLDWSGAPGVTPGFIKIKGRFLR
jgi:hypothetical protein